MLKKFNIKQSDVCDFCKEESDSNFHMLISCNTIQALWQEINYWITEKLTTNLLIKKILGDTTNKTFATIIIVHVKRAIYSSKINNTIPTFNQVKILLRNTRNHERYMATMKGGLDQFEKPGAVEYIRLSIALLLLYIFIFNSLVPSSQKWY